MLPAALPPSLATAGPAVVISVLAKQQHQNALQHGIHQCARPLSDTHREREWRMPEVVRECPEGVMICSGFPNALEKVVESFAFQQKNESLSQHYASLHPPCVVSEFVSAAVLTFTSPFRAASFPRTLCPRNSPDSSTRAGFIGRVWMCSSRVVSEGACLVPSQPRSDSQWPVPAGCEGTPQPQPCWGSHSCSP